MTKAAPFITAGAHAGAAAVGLALLANASTAHARLAAGKDGEALHDLRVALRRLRSQVRAYRPWLEPSISRPLRRRLKRLTRATNAARDRQVQLAWLRERRRVARGHELTAINGLIRTYTSDAALLESQVRDELTHRFPRLHSRLKARLQRAGDSARDTAPAFCQTAALAIRRQASALRRSLTAVRSVQAVAAIHSARIAGKKLRYLVEPFAKEVPGGRRIVESLKALQDCLGELHDRILFCDDLRRMTEAAQVNERRAVALGMGALVERIEGEIEEYYRLARRRFLGRHADGLIGRCNQYARTLALQERHPRRKAQRAHSAKTSAPARPSP